jgi:hypothetical protein
MDISSNVIWSECVHDGRLCTLLLVFYLARSCYVLKTKKLHACGHGLVPAFWSPSIAVCRSQSADHS